MLLLAAGVIKRQRVEQVGLGSDPATTIGIGGSTVIELSQEEVSVVVGRVELEAQAVKGLTEVIELDSGLTGIWCCIIKPNFEGEAPANVSSPILNPESVALPLFFCQAQVVKTEALVVPAGQQLVDVTEGSTIGRVMTGVVQNG